jgi:hypothetical protein
MAANSRASESSVLPTLSRRCLLASVADHALLDDAPTLLPWTITTAVVLPEVTALVEMDMATATAVRDATTTTTVLAIDPHLVVLWKTILPLLLAVDTMIHTDATTLLPRRILTPMGDPHTTDLPEISLPPERVDTHETVAILETMIVVDVTGKFIFHYRFGRLLGRTVLDRRCTRSSPTEYANWRGTVTTC